LINHFRLRGGLLNGLSSDKEIPFFEYFILGDVGFYGLRGYDIRSVGTKVGYNVIGGKVFGVITYELRLRLGENFYILGFLEGGNAWWELRTVNLREIKRSAGIGIRANIPLLGIMGIDLGYGFDEPSKGFRPHFQIGTGF
jgi:outer membrane protein insertion porin family